MPLPDYNTVMTIQLQTAIPYLLSSSGMRLVVTTFGSYCFLSSYWSICGDVSLVPIGTHVVQNVASVPVNTPVSESTCRPIVVKNVSLFPIGLLRMFLIGLPEVQNVSFCFIFL
jgi:hypothetical protein